jgi:hypothetical protein
MIAGYILKIAFFHWQSLHASEGKNLVGQSAFLNSFRVSTFLLVNCKKTNANIGSSLFPSVNIWYQVTMGNRFCNLFFECIPDCYSAMSAMLV